MLQNVYIGDIKIKKEQKKHAKRRNMKNQFFRKI